MEDEGRAWDQKLKGGFLGYVQERSDYEELL